MTIPVGGGSASALALISPTSSGCVAIDTRAPIASNTFAVICWATVFVKHCTRGAVARMRRGSRRMGRGGRVTFALNLQASVQLARHAVAVSFLTLSK